MSEQRIRKDNSTADRSKKRRSTATTGRRVYLRNAADQTGDDYTEKIILAIQEPGDFGPNLPQSRQLCFWSCVKGPDVDCVGGTSRERAVKYGFFVQPSQAEKIMELLESAIGSRIGEGGVITLKGVIRVQSGG